MRGAPASTHCRPDFNWAPSLRIDSVVATRVRASASRFSDAVSFPFRFCSSRRKWSRWSRAFGNRSSASFAGMGTVSWTVDFMAASIPVERGNASGGRRVAPRLVRDTPFSCSTSITVIEAVVSRGRERRQEGGRNRKESPPVPQGLQSGGLSLRSLPIAGRPTGISVSIV